MNPVPRVAFFTDSFHEVNGVAHTSRHFDAFARRRALPFLNVHAGPKTLLCSKIWHALTPTWIFLPFPHTRILSGMSCWKRWRPVCRWSQLPAAGRSI